MELPLKQSSSFGRASSVDVSQLDKVNAIPNKTSDNILMDDLCHDDKLYLSALMDYDSSDDDEYDNADKSRVSSAWSPMISSPVVMNKRIKKLRPSYAVTLSLEDISYIRPSWGISKGMRTIELNKQRAKASKILDKGSKKNNDHEIKKSDVETITAATTPTNTKKKVSSEKGSVNNEGAYSYFLILLTFVVLLLTVPSYIVEKRKELARIKVNKIKVNPASKVFEIYKPNGDSSDLILKVLFAQGIPRDLKPDECTCDIYETEAKLYNNGYGGGGDVGIVTTNNYSDINRNNEESSSPSVCFSCLDWAVRANLRVHVEQTTKSSQDSNLIPSTNSFCYKIKWQSYDSLRTPLIDCFVINNDLDEQWFGLGDIQTSPSWPLNKQLQFDWTNLDTNLSAEFLESSLNSNNNNNESKMSSSIIYSDLNQYLSFGSYVNFSLFSTHGIHINDIKTDFQISIKLMQDFKLGTKNLCISATCTDKCRKSWLRSDHLNEFKYINNILEYKICSGLSMKSLVSQQLTNNVKNLEEIVKKFDLSPSSSSQDYVSEFKYESERSFKSTQPTLPQPTSTATNTNTKSQRIIERENSKIESITSTTGSGAASLSTPTTSTSTDLSKLSFSEPLMNNYSNESSSISESITNKLPEGIGLIERTIFATSLEFMPILDGQTLRQYVDSIVKFGLKTSSILLIDTRWETYVGSLKLNMALFPKAKLLFEILHNKGFKIVFTIKPYIDTGIGISNINQLFNIGRLYAASYMKDTFVERFGKSSIEKVSIKESVIRRLSLFKFQNESIYIGPNDTVRFPYLTKCKESQDGYCVLLDLTKISNRNWLINSIKRSNLLTVEADGIQVGGAHPNGFNWDDHYRSGISELCKSLFYKEKLYIIPQYTGDFGYIQLAPRSCTWDGLRSMIDSVLNLSINGFSLIHPGSVWGDLKSANSNQSESSHFKSPNKMDSIYGDLKPNEKSDVELVMRWLQVAIFLPILQFNNIAPIENHGLQELLQNLIKIRKIYIVPELKKNLPFTPLINQSTKTAQNSDNSLMMPLIRPVWYNQEMGETIVTEQFKIGSEILVAPILVENLRQRDIYLPTGFWRDELRQINIRGGKWLRNYPVELNEIAWFTQARRR